MNVCFVASEVVPFSKTGGLGDVAGALPRALSENGCDVRIFTPFYNTVDTSECDVYPVDYLQNVRVRVGDRTIIVSIFTTRLPGTAVDVYLVECPALYHRGAIYTDHDDEYLRFFVLSYTTLLCCQYMAWSPQIIHCNDWQTALIPVLLRTLFHWDELFRKTRSVLTIHNIAYQGIFPSRIIDDVGLGAHKHLFFQEDLQAGIVNYMKAGILYADMITTVSRNYAREIQTAEYGAGLDVLLRRRRDALIGIVNGIDPVEWGPETDAYIPHCFSKDDLRGKERNREALMHRMELPFSPNVPILGIVSRLTAQKGFDLFFDIIDPIIHAYDMRLVILGSGEKKYEQFFAALERRYPQRVCFYRGFSNELAHLIEAGSDAFLMPSKFEPCGLNQIYSMRYGTIPVVRKTGGLADTVTNFNALTGEGTGFVFEHFTPEGLAWAIETAMKTWYMDRAAWRQLVNNAMSVDFTWDHQVKEYLVVYRRIVQQ